MKKSFIFTPSIYSHISNDHHHHQIYKELDYMSKILGSFSQNFTFNLTWHSDDAEFHIDFWIDFGKNQHAWHLFYRRLGYLQGRLFNGSWILIDKDLPADLEFMKTFCSGETTMKQLKFEKNQTRGRHLSPFPLSFIKPSSTSFL